jgi:exoribonuclease-2
MQKRIAAVVLHPRIGQVFRAIVTGVNQHGTFVRALDPHVEGMLVSGGKRLDVGDRIQARLIGTDPARGFIDFAVA